MVLSLKLQKNEKVLRLVLPPPLSYRLLNMFVSLPYAKLNFSPKQLRDSHLRWFITSVDGYPFFYFFKRVILT